MGGALAVLYGTVIIITYGKLEDVLRSTLELSSIENTILHRGRYVVHAYASSIHTGAMM